MRVLRGDKEQGWKKSGLISNDTETNEILSLAKVDKGFDIQT